MLELWWTPATDMPPANTLALLSPHETGRLGSLRRPQDRAEYASAHVLLQQLLRSRFGANRVELSQRPCPCCSEAHGRPYVHRPSTELELSLSHGGGLVAVALCDRGPIGVDTESVVDISTLNDVSPLLHPEERKELARTPQEKRQILFTRIWVRKEAYLKAIGTGLGRDTRLDCVAPGRPELHPDGWVFHEINLGAGTSTVLCGPIAAGSPAVQGVDLRGC